MSRKQRFLQLYPPVSERLERFALYLERNRQEAKELVCETIASAFQRADTAMYAAKSAGRNRVVASGDLQENGYGIDDMGSIDAAAA